MEPPGVCSCCVHEHKRETDPQTTTLWTVRERNPLAPLGFSLRIHTCNDFLDFLRSEDGHSAPEE